MDLLVCEPLKTDPFGLLAIEFKSNSCSLDFCQMLVKWVNGCLCIVCQWSYGAMLHGSDFAGGNSKKNIRIMMICARLHMCSLRVYICIYLFIYL